LLSLLAASNAVHQPIYWVNLGLKRGIDLHFFTLRYYSLAYLAGIMLGYWLLSRMIRQSGAPLAQRHVDDFFLYSTLGIILGGRLGYATFYEPSLWTSLNIFKLWEGGMSFHGGVIGVLVAIAYVARSHQLSFLRLCDYISVCVPFGMLFGRLANFVNGELWGKVAGADVAWAMVFPGAGDLPRHPSQLYEALLEGAILAVIMQLLFWQTRARWRPGLLVGIFATWIAAARFGIEFFREPDAQLSEFALRTGLSMGQWLTVPLLAAGLFFAARALVKPEMGKS
jgi:phosphatidylglycerol:prolipoprotein diacylglycerol transferase